MGNGEAGNGEAEVEAYNYTPLLPRDRHAGIGRVRTIGPCFDGGGEMMSERGVMFSDLPQGDFDGAGDIHSCTFRGGAHAPEPPTKTNRPGEFARETVDLSGQPLAPAQIVKLPRFL